jgi:hypothetical protein
MQARIIFIPVGLLVLYMKVSNVQQVQNSYEKQPKTICRYPYLLHFYQRSLLHVSATYCGHLQGSVVCKMHYIGR